MKQHKSKKGCGWSAFANHDLNRIAQSVTLSIADMKVILTTM